MKKEQIVEETTNNFVEGVSTAKLLIADDGIHLIDDGVDKGVLALSKDELSYALPINSSNRKRFGVKKVNDAIAIGQTEIILTYKASVHFGSTGNKIPNAKLISYLEEDLQKEYKAIIERAKAKRDEEKKKPIKSLVDYMSNEDYKRFNELLDLAEEAKKNAPKAPRAHRASMTMEQKRKMHEGRLAKAKADLERMLAAQNNG